MTPAKKLRDYLCCGFFMADDFHGTVEWEVLKEGLKLVFPDRPIVDIPDSDAIFHTVYDLDERYQITVASIWYRLQKGWICRQVARNL